MIKKIISIVGPTSTGKTDLALRFAKKFNTQIISADSMQIYKEFNILTAKPCEKIIKDVKHNFINYISVTQDFNVSKFLNEAKKIIKNIHLNNKIPIIVGGTGFYIDALLNDYKLRERKNRDDLIDNIDEDYEDIYNQLLKVDPEFVKKNHKSDKKRIKNAFLFYKEFGESISTQKTNTINFKSPYEVMKIGLNFNERSILYNNINKRVDKMVLDGLIEEVKYINKNYVLSKTAMEAIGYKEIVKYLTNEISLKDAIELVKIHTRRYAKRQITWFKRDKDIIWYDALNPLYELI